MVHLTWKVRHLLYRRSLTYGSKLSEKHSEEEDAGTLRSDDNNAKSVSCAKACIRISEVPPFRWLDDAERLT